MNNLSTNFAISNPPINDYPRPQLKRDSFFNLNGEWNLTISSDEGLKYEGNIIVPFSPECALSGVNMVVMPNETLHYTRIFSLPDGFCKDDVLLHFDAVDYECTVILNGEIIIKHKGGYYPFLVSIKPKTGENTLEVYCKDPSDTGYQARGKQKLIHDGIWYTPQSGIWQTVWIESVNRGHIEDIRLTPDIDKGTLAVKIASESEKFTFTVYDGKKEILSSVGGAESELKLPKGFECWSPEKPKLYDIVIETDGDKVTSYFGMRKFSQGIDESGHQRFFLNNKPYFLNGVLDQGYYPDTLLTPKSDEAMLYDLTLVKETGFNSIRKHIKIEPLRFYYLCDKIGLILWQDMVSGGGTYAFRHVTLPVFIPFNIRDCAYKKLARDNADSRAEYYDELFSTLSHLKNVVSIAIWVPFNEGWGQFDSIKVTGIVRAMDDTRLIDSASGWHDQPKSTSNFYSRHVYFHKLKIGTRKNRIAALTEFGGYAYYVDGHSYSANKFGYRDYKSVEELRQAVKTTYLNVLLPQIKKGLSALVFTQLSDVEEEVNGIVTYDRKVEKFDRQFLRDIMKQMKLK